MSELSKEDIGFIGLGLMGYGMAKNICEKGFRLTFLKGRKADVVADMTKRGASAVNTAKEVAERAAVILICVNSSAQVETIVRGPDGLKSGLRQGSVIIDCSTSDPTSTLSLVEELAPFGVEFVDAPLSRTPKEAWEGTLDTMVGASLEVFEPSI